MAFGKGKPFQRKGEGRYGGGWRRDGIWTRKHFDGGYQGRSDGHTRESGTGIAEIRKMLETVTRSVSVLAEHVQKLERGPDQNPDGPNTGQESAAGPHTTIKSNNDDFASVVKDMYRLVQLGHHGDNWSQLPKSLAERLARFASDINPPMVDEDFRSVVKEATRVYSERICDAVRQHIARKKAETESAAAKRDDTDLDRAKEVVGRQLTRRLGRRLDETKRQQLLDQAATAIGSGRRRPQIDGDGFQVVISRKKSAASPGNVQTPTKKRKFDSTPPVSTSNRFSVMQTDDIVTVASDVESDDDAHDVDDDDTNDVKGDDDVDDGDKNDARGDDDVDDDDTSDVRGDDDVDDGDTNDARGDDDNTVANNATNEKVVDSYLAAAKTAVVTGTERQAAAPAAIVPERQQQQQQRIAVTAEIHSRTRSHSLDRPTRMLKPSSQVMRTQAGVNVFSGKNKDDWKILPAADTKALLIGDSNLRNFSLVPTGWEVHCLPGARFNHINNALEDVLIRRSNSLSVVYVQAGINHRDQHPDEYRRQLQRLMMLNSQTDVTIAFVGVPTSTKLTPEQRSNIDALNELMSNAFVDQFVEPLADGQVEILQKDNIHHSAWTSRKIMTSICKHAQLVHHLN